MIAVANEKVAGAGDESGGGSRWSLQHLSSI